MTHYDKTDLAVLTHGKNFLMVNRFTSIVAVGQHSGGRLVTTLVATINVIIFSLFSSRRLLFSLKERSDQKTNLDKIDGSAPKPRGRPLSRPCRPFWDPLAAILDF